MNGRVRNVRLPGERHEALGLGGGLDAAHGPFDSLFDIAHSEADYDLSYQLQGPIRKPVVLSFAAVLQTAHMTVENRRRAFREWMTAKNLTAAEVARRATIPPTTLYSFLDGKSQSLKGATEQKIASAFGIPVEVLFTSGSDLRREVGVWGKIGAGAEVYPLSDYTDAPMYEVTLPPGLDPDDEYVGFEIEGFSMPPAEPGWVVIFRRVESEVEDLVNSPCLIDTEDGRRLFKRLRRGYAPGRYNLESWDGSPLIEDVHVLRALPFASLTPGRRAR